MSASRLDHRGNAITLKGDHRDLTTSHNFIKWSISDRCHYPECLVTCSHLYICSPLNCQLIDGVTCFILCHASVCPPTDLPPPRLWYPLTLFQAPLIFTSIVIVSLNSDHVVKHSVLPLSTRDPSLDVRIWRLHVDVRFWRLKTVHALEQLK